MGYMGYLHVYRRVWLRSLIFVPNFGFNRFYWTKNGLKFNPRDDPRLKNFENSGSFIIPKYRYLAQYQGKYRCYASNKLGIAMSEETHFIVPCKLFSKNISVVDH